MVKSTILKSRFWHNLLYNINEAWQDLTETINLFSLICHKRYLWIHRFTKVQARCEYLSCKFVVGCPQLLMNQLGLGNLNAITSLFLLHRNKRNKDNGNETNPSENKKLRTKKNPKLKKFAQRNSYFSLKCRIMIQFFLNTSTQILN